MSTRQAKIIVKKYANLLKKKHFTFAKVYLFGSYATGQAKTHSDIDVAVIVKKAAAGQKYLNDKMRLWELTTAVDARIEPVIIEEKELTKEPSSLGQQIAKYGLKIE